MHKESAKLLNKAVTDELYTVHQYMYFHFHCDDQGFDILAGLFKRTAIEEMQHIEQFAERILFLKGDVDLKPPREVKTVQDVKDMLELAVKLEEQTVKDYNTWANECAAHADSVSRKLFEDIVVAEERHFDQFETELENIHKFGENYLALQSIERSKNVGSGTAPE